MAEAEKMPGGSVSLHARRIVANDTGPAISAAPTLGEIVDMLATAYPDRDWPCDPAFREVRVTSVVIED